MNDVIQIPPSATVQIRLERLEYDKYKKTVLIEHVMTALEIQREYNTEAGLQARIKHDAKLQKKELERIQGLLPEVKKDLARLNKENGERKEKFEKWAEKLSGKYPELSKGQVLAHLDQLYRNGEKNVYETAEKNTKIEAAKIRAEKK